MKVNGQEFVTIQEMAKKLSIPPNTVKQRLFQHNIKPVSKDALYDLSALDAIKNTAMGRPKKAAGQDTAKPRASKTKAAKQAPKGKKKE
jgi:predicted ArsR family transcriptional regulator